MQDKLVILPSRQPAEPKQALRSNLPAQLTQLIGREQEMLAASALLHRPDVYTLIPTRMWCCCATPKRTTLRRPSRAFGMPCTISTSRSRHYLLLYVTCMPPSTGSSWIPSVPSCLCEHDTLHSQRHMSPYNPP